MTVEELRKEAEALGYSIVPKRKYERLLPCVCGCTRREHLFKESGADVVDVLKCSNCGRSVEGKNEAKARHNWNLMIGGGV